MRIHYLGDLWKYCRLASVTELEDVADLKSAGNYREGSSPSRCIAPSPSGKAQHFDCCIRWFESNRGRYGWKRTSYIRLMTIRKYMITRCIGVEAQNV